jgi:hypothetical protein
MLTQFNNAQNGTMPTDTAQNPVAGIAENLTTSQRDTTSDEAEGEEDDTTSLDLASLAEGESPKFKAILGHNSFETAKAVEDYPYGRRWRCTMYYWIESKKNFGDRLVKRSINPKNNRLNKPHPGQYSSLLWLFEAANGHIKATGGDIRSSENAVRLLKAVQANVGLENLNNIQQFNIRTQYLTVFTYESNCEIREILPEHREDFEKWFKSMIQHIGKGPFIEILNLPEKPDFPRIPDQGMRA